MTGRGSFAHHSCEYYEVRWSAVNWYLAVARMNGEDASLDYNSGIEHQSSDGTCYDLIWFCWKTVWELSGLQLTLDWEMSVIGQHHGRSCNSSTGNLWGCEVGKLTWQGCNVLSERIFRFDLLTPINKKSRTFDVIGIEEVLFWWPSIYHWFGSCTSYCCSSVVLVRTQISRSTKTLLARSSFGHKMNRKRIYIYSISCKKTR